MMPAFFLAAALVETRDVRGHAALASCCSRVVLTAAEPGLGQHAWPAIAWQARCGAAAPCCTSGTREPAATAVADRRGRPASVRSSSRCSSSCPSPWSGIIVLRRRLPAVRAAADHDRIQFLIFIGVVHHRFYDIEVRAARSGELAAQAAEQERLALLGELSATLAHEIRNPLTGMRSLAQRLAEPTSMTRAHALRRRDPRRDRRLERIVGNLLDVGRRSVVRATRNAAATPLDRSSTTSRCSSTGARARAGDLERDAAALVAARRAMRWRRRC
jgi:signal transduction histidine kinase